MPRTIPTWRAMTDDEREMAKALRAIDLSEFDDDTPSAKIAETLGRMADEPNGYISEGQATALRSLVRQFRRRLPPAIVVLAEAPR